MTKELILDALQGLTSHGFFDLVKFKYDEVHFGNIYIELKSNTRMKIRFIKDKGTSWCEIGLENEWYFVEDAFSYLEIPKIPNRDNFIEMIKITAQMLNDNFEKVIKLCDAKYIKKAQNGIKQIAIKRLEKIFKQ